MRGGLWGAPVHTSHTRKPVITFVFKVLRNGLFTAPVHTLHMPKPVRTFVFKVLRNGLLTASVYTLYMPKHHMVVSLLRHVHILLNT